MISQYIGEYGYQVTGLVLLGVLLNVWIYSAVKASKLREKLREIPFDAGQKNMFVQFKDEDGKSTEGLVVLCGRYRWGRGDSEPLKVDVEHVERSWIREVFQREFVWCTVENGKDETEERYVPLGQVTGIIAGPREEYLLDKDGNEVK